MNSYGNGGSLARQLITWLIVGLVALVALKVALVTFGIAIRVLLFAAFTLGPLLLVGWLAFKALRYFSRPADANSHL